MSPDIFVSKGYNSYVALLLRVRVVEVWHTACKAGFRRNPRPRSSELFIFSIKYTQHTHSIGHPVPLGFLMPRGPDPART